MSLINPGVSVNTVLHCASTDHNGFTYSFQETVHTPIPATLLVVEAEDEDGSSDGDNLVFTVTSNPVTVRHVIVVSSLTLSSHTCSLGIQGVKVVYEYKGLMDTT